MLKDSSVTGYELLVFCYLNELAPLKEREKYLIHIDAILFAIYEKTDVSQQIRENIFKAVNNLIEKEFIVADKHNKASYIVQQSSLKPDIENEHFTIITLSDIKLIMQSDSLIKPQLVKYYIYLMSTINSQIVVYNSAGEQKRNVVGKQTQEYLASLTGISTHTIMRYNAILEQLGAIYVYRANDFKINDSRITQLPNVYGRGADKEFIIKHGEDQKKWQQTYNVVHPKQDAANTKRRLAQMYIQLCKGKTYSDEEIREIYYYITVQKKKYRNLAESEQNKSYLENIKDETVFRQFEFLEFGKE